MDIHRSTVAAVYDRRTNLDARIRSCNEARTDIRDTAPRVSPVGFEVLDT
jgi:hypothetical protein